MVSLSRKVLIEQLQEEFDAFWGTGGDPKGMDTLRVQMASVDEMMSAWGYAPRRLEEYPDVKDGRFGYYRVNPARKLGFISFKDAVQFHNGGPMKGNPFRRRDDVDGLTFAWKNRIVHIVRIQRKKRGKIVDNSSHHFIKFVEGVE